MKELNECVEKTFDYYVKYMIYNLLHAKLPTHLKRPIFSAYINDTFDQLVAQLEPELELRSLKNDGEL